MPQAAVIGEAEMEPSRGPDPCPSSSPGTLWHLLSWDPSPLAPRQLPRNQSLHLGGEGEGGPGDEELSTSLALQQKLQEVQG